MYSMNTQCIYRCTTFNDMEVSLGSINRLTVFENIVFGNIQHSNAVDMQKAFTFTCIINKYPAAK